ncbi:hypothetical protein MRX96_038526 [Rhipicephalus microplus]
MKNKRKKEKEGGAWQRRHTVPKDTWSCRATGTISSGGVWPRRGYGGGGYPSSGCLVYLADNVIQSKKHQRTLLSPGYLPRTTCHGRASLTCCGFKASCARGHAELSGYALRSSGGVRPGHGYGGGAYPSSGCLVYHVDNDPPPGWSLAPSPPPPQYSILSLISYVGCITSIVGLLFTILTYSFFRCCSSHRWNMLGHRFGALQKLR